MSDAALREILEAIAAQRRVFVSYHHELDQIYYDTFSRQFCELYECLRDNSLARAIDSEDVEYVMRRIRERYITGTSCTVVLCGRETRWRKYIDWEIKATLDKQHGLIGIRLPTNPPDAYGGVHKPDRLQDNISSGYAQWIDWSDLQKGPVYFRAVVELARARPKSAIVNSRALRGRNGP